MCYNRQDGEQFFFSNGIVDKNNHSTEMVIIISILNAFSLKISKYLSFN